MRGFQLTGKLILSVRKLVDLLQLMNPVEFMDAHDWFNKLGFYARMSVEHASLGALPPYLQSPCGRPGTGICWIGSRDTCRKSELSGLIVTPSLFQYLVEANDLRPQMDILLRQAGSGR